MPLPLPSPFRSHPVAVAAFVVATAALLLSATVAEARGGAGERATFELVADDEALPIGDARTNDASVDGAVDAAASEAATAAADVPRPKPVVMTTTVSATALTPSPDDSSSGFLLTHRQWLYVLIAAGLGVLLLMAVPTRT